MFLQCGHTVHGYPASLPNRRLSKKERLRTALTTGHGPAGTRFLAFLNARVFPKEVLATFLFPKFIIARLIVRANQRQPVARWWHSSSSCWRLRIIVRSITYICLQFLQVLLMWWNLIINRCLWLDGADKINLSDKSREDTALKLGLWAQCVNVTSDSWNSAESPVGLWRSRRPYDP